MAIGPVVGSTVYVPPNQASVERLKELAAPTTFVRPDLAKLPKPNGRLQPRQLVLSYQKSVGIRKLLEDAGGSRNDLANQLASLEEHLRAGGSLLSLLESDDSLQSSLLYILASELSANLKTSDSKFSGVVDAEIRALMSYKGEEINAAINSASSFATFKSASVDRRWLRAGYLAVVSTQGSFSDLLESLLVRFGPNGFKAGALVMLKGINDDLTSATPSIRPAKLHLLLLSSLVAMRHLTAFIHATTAFAKSYKPEILAEAALTKTSHLDSNSGVDDQGPVNQGNNESDEEEALTIKTFLQLISGQGSIKLLQRYLEDHFGQNLGWRRNEQIYKDFIAFIQNLPLALWRERSHKDKLLEALRKQLFVDQLDHSTLR